MPGPGKFSELALPLVSSGLYLYTPDGTCAGCVWWRPLVSLNILKTGQTDRQTETRPMHTLTAMNVAVVMINDPKQLEV